MGLTLEPGAVFAGEYRVVERLGQGGMGSVYVVEQASTGARRALKLLLPHLAADPQARERFAREAKIGSRIPSDHVVQVIAAGVDEASGAPWLAMELLEGESLAARVARTGPLSTAEVRAVIAQLGHALGAAHAAGVVHRDLKPDNLHVASNRRAGEALSLKVLDFGIAKLVLDSAASDTAPMGTVAWMAPEQTERGPIGPATDVWSVGLIAFWLVTGRVYWRVANEEGGSALRLMREVVVEPLAPASARAKELDAEVPAGFDAWFARCVTRDVKERFTDGGAACDALVALLGGASGTRANLENAPTQAFDIGSGPTASIGTDATMAAPPTTAPKKRSGGRVVFGAVAAVVIAAGAIGTAMSLRREIPTQPAASAALSAAPSSSSVAIAPQPSATPITSLPPPKCSNAKALGLYAAALQSMRDASWDNATERLKEAAALDPACALIQLRLAQATEGEERAAAYARAVEGRAQMSKRDRLLLGIWEPLVRATRDVGAAVNRATAATEALPRDAEFFEHICANEVDDDRAIAACRQATTIDPEYADAWSDLGQRLKRLGRYTQSIEAFDRCVAVSPTTIDCRTSRTGAYSDVGRCEEAEADLRQAVQSSPHSAETRLDWAVALFDLRRPEEAVIEAFKQGIAAFPADRRAFEGPMRMHWLWLRLGRWSDADAQIREAERALTTTTKPLDREQVVWNRTFWLLLLGRNKEAGRGADTFLKRRAGFGGETTSGGEPLLQYARHLAGLVSAEELEALRADWVERWSRDYPRSKPWDTWFYVHRLTDERAEAERALAGMPEGEPAEPECLRRLGETYANAGRFDEALPLLRRAVRSCEGRRSAETSLPLARSLEETGDTTAACAIYTRIAKTMGRPPLPVFVQRANERAAKLGCK